MCSGSMRFEQRMLVAGMPLQNPEFDRKSKPEARPSTGRGRLLERERSSRLPYRNGVRRGPVASMTTDFHYRPAAEPRGRRKTLVIKERRTRYLDPQQTSFWAT